MGCIDSKPAADPRAPRHRREVRQGSASGGRDARDGGADGRRGGGGSGADGRGRGESAASSRSKPVAIGGGPAGTDRDGGIGRGSMKDEAVVGSIDGRIMERQFYTNIVLHAQDTFIDTAQTALEMEDEEAVDEGMLELRHQLKDVALPHGGVATSALPKSTVPSRGGSVLYDMLSADPVSPDAVALITQASALIADSVRSVGVVAPDERIVVGFASTRSSDGR